MILFRSLSLRIALVLSSCLWASCEPRFSAYSSSVVQKGQDAYGQIREEGEAEGFLDWLFGTNCYSKAVLSLSHECKQLSQEEQSRLALELASCFYANSGKGAIPCPGRQDVRTCTAKMDQQAFNTYQQFFLNVYSMCTFLENQNFQKQTEAMMRDMQSNTEKAAAQMHDIAEVLEDQRQGMNSLGEQIVVVDAKQRDLAVGIDQGNKQLRKLHNNSRALAEKMNESLELEGELQKKQTLLQTRLHELEQDELQRSQLAARRWEIAEDRGKALEERQIKYEQLQEKLVGASEALAESSDTLQRTMDLVVEYEERSTMAIKSMLGTSISKGDFLFYGLSVLAALLCGTFRPLAGARAILILLIALSLAVERTVMERWKHLLDVDADGRVLMELPLLWFLPMEHPTFQVEMKSLIRRLCLTACFASVAYLLVAYKNLERENHYLLKNIEKFTKEAEMRYLDALDRYKSRVVDEFTRVCAQGTMVRTERRVQEATSALRLQDQCDTDCHVQHKRHSNFDKHLYPPRSPIRTRSISRAESIMDDLK